MNLSLLFAIINLASAHQDSKNLYDRESVVITSKTERSFSDITAAMDTMQKRLLLSEQDETAPKYLRGSVTNIDELTNCQQNEEKLKLRGMPKESIVFEYAKEEEID